MSIEHGKDPGHRLVYRLSIAHWTVICRGKSIKRVYNMLHLFIASALADIIYYHLPRTVCIDFWKRTPDFVRNFRFCIDLHFYT